MFNFELLYFEMKNNTTNTKSSIKIKVPSAKSKSSSVVTTTHEGKTISFRILSSTEIKAIRNSAYQYLK
jgi:hypothetical protein